MKQWPDYYILMDRTAVAVDVLTWGRWFADIANRRIGEGRIGNVRISTVFLGLNHNCGEPLLFETMIFGGPLDGEMWRYASYAEAECGHQHALSEANKAALQIKQIADAAGVKS